MVTKYRRHTLKCLSCGTTNQAQWLADIPTGSFGSRTQAIVAYLSGRLHLSHRDVVEAMEVLHGLSLGSGSAIQRQVSAALARCAQMATGYVQRQAVNQLREGQLTQTNWRRQMRRLEREVRRLLMAGTDA